MKKQIMKICSLLCAVVLLMGVFAGCQLGKDDSNVTIFNAANASGELTAYKAKQQDNGITFANSVNYENKYFFYYFYLGEVSQIPLYTSVALKYDYDTEVTFNFGKLTSESLSNSISKTTEVIDTHSYTGGLTVGAENETEFNIGAVKDRLKISIEGDFHWTNNWGKTMTDSQIATNTYLSQYSEGYSEKVTFSKDAGFTKGNYYRMSFYDYADVYGVVVYDVINNSYSTTTDFFLKSNTTVRVWEESSSGVYNYKQEKDIEFDVNKAIEYAETHKLELNESASTPTLQPSIYYIPTQVLSCKLDNGYNYNQADSNANNIHYSHNFEFGQFVVEGCQRSGEQIDVYSVVSNTNVSFRLTYDADSLPLQDNMTCRRIEHDTKQSNFYNLPWSVGEREVGKGMIVALVEYNDGTPSDKICITNAFDGCKSGGLVTIAGNINKPCKVTIAICYELVMWAPGFLGIVDDYWMNWRINQTFYFV